MLECLLFTDRLQLDISCTQQCRCFVFSYESYKANERQKERERKRQTIKKDLKEMSDTNDSVVPFTNPQQLFTANLITAYKASKY